METKRKTETKKEFRVTRYWPVEYRSIAFVQASSPEEAARLALEDDDYSDQESCDGSDGAVEVGQIVEITPDGLKVEHRLPEAVETDNGADLREAAAAVVAAWEHGDLAAAVRNLAAALDG